MPVLSAGKLDRRITFQAPVERIESGLFPVKAWADLVETPKMWAEVTTANGSEFSDPQIVSEFDATFRVRYRDDLTTSMRIVYGGKNYNVKSVRELGRREFLEILGKVVE